MPPSLPASFCQDDLRFALGKYSIIISLSVQPNYYIQIVYKRYLLPQFSIAYNIYLSLRREVNKHVKEALGRQDGDWRIKHTCPACMYKLKNEPTLIFDMLWAMDGNDSLKRRIRRAPKGEGGEPGPSIERIDTRNIDGEIYLSRKDVNQWARELVDQEPSPAEGVCYLSSWQSFTDSIVLQEPGYNSCTERWKNMVEEITNRM